MNAVDRAKRALGSHVEKCDACNADEDGAIRYCATARKLKARYDAERAKDLAP